MLDEIKDIKSGKKELREFGITIGVALPIFALLITFFLKKSLNWQLIGIVSFVFISLGLIFPAILRPAQKVWMAIAIIIGFFMSRVILSILFFIAITPIGLLMRLFGKDLLDEKIDKNKDSYWHDIKEHPKPKKSYENQF